MARTPARKAGVLDGITLLPVRDGLSAGGRWIRKFSSAILAIRVARSGATSPASMEEQLSRINSDLGRVIATVIAREWSAASRAIAHDAIRGVGGAIIYQRVLK